MFLSGVVAAKVGVGISHEVLTGGEIVAANLFHDIQ